MYMYTVKIIIIAQNIKNILIAEKYEFKSV